MKNKSYLNIITDMLYNLNSFIVNQFCDIYFFDSIVRWETNAMEKGRIVWLDWFMLF